MKRAVRRAFRCSIVLLLAALWSSETGLAQDAAKPSITPNPRIHEELIGEASATGKIGTVITRTMKRVFWIEELPRHKQALWVDGKQLGTVYDEIGDVVPGKDDQQVAFTTRRHSKWVLVVNGKDRTPEFDDMSSPDITVDGRFVVLVRQGRKWKILDNGQFVGSEFVESKWFRESPASGIGFDDSGTHYGFVGHLPNNKWITIIDGKETGVEMDRVREAVYGGRIVPADFAWAGAHFVVTGQIKGAWVPVVDGQPQSGFDMSSAVTNAVLGCGRPFPAVMPDRIGNAVVPKEAADAVWLQVSPDGSHLAYERDIFEYDKSLTGLTYTSRITIDGKAEAEFQSFNREHLACVRNFQFSQDSKHYLYQVHSFRRTTCWLFEKNCAGRDQNWIVVDGARLDSYDDVLPGARFVGQHAEFLARQGKKLLRVTYNLRQ